jgi:hypothetical protein
MLLANQRRFTVMAPGFSSYYILSRWLQCTIGLNAAGKSEQIYGVGPLIFL